MRWFIFAMCCVVFFAFVHTVDAQTSVLIRALLPNPTGSDTTEWILIENIGEDTVDADSLVLQDVEGSVKTYTIQQSLLTREFVFVSATQSGIALNNAQDRVELLFQGQKVAESLAYTDAQNDQVWWQSEDGDWQWEDKNLFLERMKTGDFALVAQEKEATVTASPTPQGSVPETTAKNKKVLETPVSAQEPSEEYQGKKHDLLLADTAVPTYLKKSLQDIPFPEFDFDTETERFVLWKKQALQGSLGLIVGGMAWLIVCFPYWWQRYRWRF